MFNVTRSTPSPACLAERQYNTQTVVELLEPMFFGKCYLCESDDLTDPEIEHFEPHEGDDVKKFSWNNLYYSCSRCNSIKSNIHRNLLDCCDDTINFTRKIKCTLPSTPSGLIQISAEIDPSDPKTINTVKLLDQCYNATSTPLRGITRSSLIENIYTHYINLLNYRMTLIRKESSDEEKQLAKGRIKSMLEVSFPYSIFWRWYVIEDTKLHSKVKDLINF